MSILPILLLAVSPIQIDGSFSDWRFRQTHMQDAHYMYKRVQLNPKSCLQQLPAPLHIEMGEYDISFSPADRGYGVSCFKDGEPISPYDIGLVFAPTTASTEFEIRINKPSAELPTRPFDLTTHGGVRVVSWNVQFGNLFDDIDQGTRILQALQPDVLLLQELDGDDSAEMVAAFLESTLGESWSVHLSQRTGSERHQQLVSAVATRLPSVAVTHQLKLPTKTAVANVTIEQQTITFVSLHLRCCGGPISEAEDQRQHEATLIRNAIDTINSDGVILAGDWNLVGTNKPLHTVQKGDFTIVDAYQPDGVLTATWSDTTSAFTPGRLDWMLASTDAIHVVRGFVLETSDLDPETLQVNNLRLDDTAELSDHLPLVADIRIISP